MRRRSYLYLKEEPLLNRMALVGGSGWSSRRKKEWCSTQFFQKILHWSREPIRNSRVSWWGPWGHRRGQCYNMEFKLW